MEKIAVSDLFSSFLCQFHFVRAYGAMWSWQPKIHARPCSKCNIWSCDVEADLLEMFCNWVVMHMTELVHGMQN